MVFLNTQLPKLAWFTFNFFFFQPKSRSFYSFSVLFTPEEEKCAKSLSKHPCPAFLVFVGAVEFLFMVLALRRSSGHDRSLLVRPHVETLIFFSFTFAFSKRPQKETWKTYVGCGFTETNWDPLKKTALIFSLNCWKFHECECAHSLGAQKNLKLHCWVLSRTHTLVEVRLTGTRGVFSALNTSPAECDQVSGYRALSFIVV